MVTHAKIISDTKTWSQETNSFCSNKKLIYYQRFHKKLFLIHRTDENVFTAHPPIGFSCENILYCYKSATSRSVTSTKKSPIGFNGKFLFPSHITYLVRFYFHWCIFSTVLFCALGPLRKQNARKKREMKLQGKISPNFLLKCLLLSICALKNVFNLILVLFYSKFFQAIKHKCFA